MPMSGSGITLKVKQLQEACWNGLVKTMLPEVWIEPPNGGILYLWEVTEGNSVLELEISEFRCRSTLACPLNPATFFLSRFIIR